MSRSLTRPDRRVDLVGMPETLERWTAAQVRELPDDGKRYEVVDGELLVTPAPTFDHQEAALQLARVLQAYVAQRALGHVVPLEGGRRPKHWNDIRELLLAVEILSPSTARADRTVKRRRYQRADVPEYWIVDLDARLVERWKPGDERPEVLAERLDWQPGGDHTPFEMDLPDFFRKVLDE